MKLTTDEADNGVRLTDLPHRHIHHGLARDRFQRGLHLCRRQAYRQAQVGGHVEQAAPEWLSFESYVSTVAILAPRLLTARPTGPPRLVSWQLFGNARRLARGHYRRAFAVAPCVGSWSAFLDQISPANALLAARTLPITGTALTAAPAAADFAAPFARFGHRLRSFW
jgi:hypothetical protein